MAGKRFANVLVRGLPTVEASNLFGQVRDELDGIVDHYKQVTLDGKVTFVEVWDILTSTIGSVTRVIEQVGQAYEGKDKKAVTLLAAEQFYDEVLHPLDLPKLAGLDGWIAGKFAENAFKSIFMSFADGSINALVNMFNRTGWFDVPAGTNNGNLGNAPSVPPTPTGFVPY